MYKIEKIIQKSDKMHKIEKKKKCTTLVNIFQHFETTVT